MTDDERLCNSPGLYFLKKFAGNVMRRIIMEACTPREVFTLSLDCISDLMLPKSCEEKAMQIVAIATGNKTFCLPDSNTGPVSNLVILGISKPMSDTTAVAATIRTMSLMFMQFFM